MTRQERARVNVPRGLPCCPQGGLPEWPARPGATRSAAQTPGLNLSWPFQTLKCHQVRTSEAGSWTRWGTDGRVGAGEPDPSAPSLWRSCRAFAGTGSNSSHLCKNSVLGTSDLATQLRDRSLQTGRRWIPGTEVEVEWDSHCPPNPIQASEYLPETGQPHRKPEPAGPSLLPLDRA